MLGKWRWVTGKRDDTVADAATARANRGKGRTVSKALDIHFARIQVEHDQKWRDDVETLPWLQFPPNWQIQVIPPFADAVVRFRVRLPSGKTKSVYLDSRCSLGYFNAVGETYWEVYPVGDDTGRCGLNDIEELLRLIGDES